MEAGGIVTIPQLQSYAAALNTQITMVGTLDNTGDTLTLGSGIGTLAVGSGGVIEGGTVVDTGGGLVINGGMQDGVA